MGAATTDIDAVETAFPLKLYTVLDESEKQGFGDVVSWKGKSAFVVHKPKKFEESIMKEYFNQTRYENFEKQLDLHGFTRLAMDETHGGSYTHKLLIRGKPNLCRFLITNIPPKRVASKNISTTRHTRHARSLSDSSGFTGLIPNWNNRACTSANDHPERIVSGNYNETVVVPDAQPVVVDCDGESLPQNDIDDDSRSVEHGENDQRHTKKHRGNNSWSPTINYNHHHGSTVKDSSDIDLDWLSLVFGERAEGKSFDGDLDNEIIHRIVDGGERRSQHPHPPDDNDPADDHPSIQRRPRFRAGI